MFRLMPPLLTLLLASPFVHAASPNANPPTGWVDLETTIPGVKLDIRYHTANNFTDASPTRIRRSWGLASRTASDRSRGGPKTLNEQGLGLLVYDAYRPLRGTLGMVAWAHRTDQVHLLDTGYIARRSGHNKGNTIDLTLIDLTTGIPLDMGTPWDTLSEASHTKNTTGEALKNRLLLKQVMGQYGWQNYWKEWWHYSYKTEEKLPHRDVPYACFEPAEGKWSEPADWKNPTFTMPQTYTVRPCELD